MMTRRMTSLAVVLLTSSLAWAGPGRGRHGDDRQTMDPERREQMLRKVHTMRLVELGSILELDTAGTLKLAERLKPFEEQRVKLRLDNFKAMEELHRAKKGESGADGAKAARQLAANRVKLAEIDQRELDEVLKGLSPEKAAKAAVFLAHFQRRIEGMAGELRRRHRGGHDD